MHVNEKAVIDVRLLVPFLNTCHVVQVTNYSQTGT